MSYTETRTVVERTRGPVTPPEGEEVEEEEKQEKPKSKKK